MNNNDDWIVISKKSPKIYVKSLYWDGFTKNGKEKWFVELSNGVILHQSDKNFSYWKKQYKDKIFL